MPDADLLASQMTRTDYVFAPNTWAAAPWTAARSRISVKDWERSHAAKWHLAIRSRCPEPACAKWL